MDSGETNPNSVNFYIVYILVLTIIYASIMLIQNFLKNRNEEIDKNVTMDYYGARGTQIVLDKLTPEQSKIRFQYLLVSVLVKAATWVKAPYLFALYNRVHGFSRSEIGYLMAVDNISALVLGPIIGGLSDMYGRKKFCIIYCLSIVVHISLRITGVKELAWIAQVFTGLCSCLLDSAFESWINFEAEYLFYNVNDEDRKKMKNSFLREIFTKQITLDCFCSIVLTGFATILYAKFDIFYPFYTSMVFAVIAAITIALVWDENQMSKLNDNKKGQDKKKQTFCEQIKRSWTELSQNCPLLCVGGIESCFKISLALFLFIWTPLLEETIGSFIHPGAIFACFMLARLIGSEIFEVFKKIFSTNSYILSILITSTSAISFILAFYLCDFNSRLIVFIYFDGLSGIFSPLFSTLRAQMIPEHLRSTIVNFFRIPINICSIVFLVLTSFLTTYQICMICGIIMIMGTILNIYLFKVHTPPDAEKRTIKMSSQFLNLYDKYKSKIEKM